MARNPSRIPSNASPPAAEPSTTYGRHHPGSLNSTDHTFANAALIAQFARRAGAGTSSRTRRLTTCACVSTYRRIACSWAALKSGNRARRSWSTQMPTGTDRTIVINAVLRNPATSVCRSAFQNRENLAERPWAFMAFVCPCHSSSPPISSAHTATPAPNAPSPQTAPTPPPPDRKSLLSSPPHPQSTHASSPCARRAEARR